MSEFSDAFDMAQEAARDVMGELISLANGETILGIVEAPEVSLGRITLGGKHDPTTGVIHVSGQDWRDAGGAQGQIIEFRGLRARVTSAVPGQGDRLQLRLEPENLFGI
jgi:hypothetical protein